MAFTVTQRARNSADKIGKEPNIVICFDGLNTCYGSSTILQIVRIGDPGLLIDGSWLIGGFRERDDQQTNLSIDNTTTSLKQQLEIDKGRGSSISSMEVGLIDFDNTMTELISPGVVVEDMLGRKAKVYLGFARDSFPEDYITVFRGIVDDIKSEAGIVKLNISHPDQKKRQRIFPKIETALDGSITNSQTTITVASTSNFLQRVAGPNGVLDTSFSSYIRIDDEIIFYTAISGNQFTGCLRGQLGTVAVAHSDEDQVDSYYRLTGNCVELALKIMLSGWQDYFVEDVQLTNFNIIGDLTTVSNSIFIRGVNVENEYGIRVGDFITTVGAANGGNNITLKEITDVTVDDFGSYMVIDGVTFTDEADTAATLSFRSKWDSLPAGLLMSPDEVDVAEHERIQQLFLSSYEYDFYLKDTIEKAEEFLEQQIYKPAGAYSLPRKARSSLGYFIGPLPSADTVTINDTTVTNPDKLKIRRSINKNFFNTIVYKYEVDPLEDKFLRGTITANTTSLDRIKIGTKALVVEAEGMREDLSGLNLAQIASNRRVDRFKFGAEFLEGIDITYAQGFNLEIGDIVILDASELQISDTTTGERGKPPKFFEIINRTMNVKTGKITIDLIDTGFEGFNRYGLVGPSSRIKDGISGTQFVIEKFYRSPFGSSEYKKWERYPLCRVKVRSSDFTTRYFQTYIIRIEGNLITVNDNMGFTPQPGDVMELSQYDFNGVTDQIKLLYVHMIDNAFTQFPSDGADSYKML